MVPFKISLSVRLRVWSHGRSHQIVNTKVYSLVDRGVESTLKTNLERVGVAVVVASRTRESAT